LAKIAPPKKYEDLLRRAGTLHMEGKFEAAATAYLGLLAERPEEPQLLYLMGLLEGQRGNFAASIERFGALLSLQPEHAEGRLALARALRASERHEDSLEQLATLIAAQPENIELRFEQATVGLLDRSRFAEAVAAYDELLERHPRHADSWLHRGHALRALGQLPEALASYQRARELNPTIAEHHLGEGEMLLALQRDQDAREAFDRAVQYNPRLVAAHLGRAAALMRRHNVVAGLVSADRARQLDPRCAEAHYLLGAGQISLGNLEEALVALDEALRLRADYPEALFARGEARYELARYDEAAQDLAQLLALRPDWPLARGNLLHNRMRAADWRGFDELLGEVVARLRAGESVVSPFAWQAVCTEEADARRCAELVTERLYAAAPRPARRARSGPRDKLRIGYVCGEFREHATAMLMSGIWEAHDRSAFEIIGVDSGQPDLSPRRARIEAALDRLVVITDISDADAALRLATLEVDVLVNLNGFFGKARPGLFALRPAPVQVNYLGFPGTLGAGYIDYLIADEIVIPPASAPYYKENIVYLPGCYQPNDRLREISAEPVSREAEGLPEEAFVFCCFNNTYKITPAVFAVWMRILARAPQAVLWLLEGAESTRGRLRAAATMAGIDAERLVFASPLPAAQHLARHRLADLFLDTTPYNAHTTASDALWAGLPLLTVRGTTFPGRVAESLLRNVGLAAPEALICADLAEYEARALALAGGGGGANGSGAIDSGGRVSGALLELRAELAAARPTAPLFDTARTTRLLESAYRYMVDRADRGLAAEGTRIAG